jgi:hypothetical protein
MHWDQAAPGGAVGVSRTADERPTVARRGAREAKVFLQGRSARRASLRAAADRRPVIVGPWLSEVGFELLYWIPMLRRLLADRDRSRVVALSRGGVGSWYAGIADTYLELFDWVDPGELHTEQVRRQARGGGQKQTAISAFEAAITAEARRRTDLADAVVLHPYVMYNRYRAVWMRRRSPRVVWDEAKYEALATPRRPGGYVAVRAYYSDCLPATAATTDKVRRVVERVARQHRVVALASGGATDDHEDVPLDDIPNVELVTPRAAASNLADQTEVISGASLLLCSYGGLSYLGPLLHVPTVALYSRETFNSVHLDVVRRMLASLKASDDDPDRIRYMILGLENVALLDGLLGAAL